MAQQAQTTVAQGVRVFLTFAAAYMLSYAFRTINAVIAGPLVTELHVDAADLGLLSSAYFLSFALMQLPLGMMLDRWGARRVEAGLMLVAAVGAFVFAWATSFSHLWLGRALIGIGVSACLMAAYKGFATWSPPSWQGSLSSWMLMAGSLGALLATQPSQALLPVVGWRGLFVGLGVLCGLSAVVLWVALPRQEAEASQLGFRAQLQGYAQVWRNPVFIATAPLGMFVQGGFMAFQSLWVGPWLTRVVGLDQAGAAHALLILTAVLSAGYMALGAVLARLKVSAEERFRKTQIWMLWGLIAFVATQVGLGLAPAQAWFWPLLGVYLAITSANLAYVQVNASFPVELIGRAATFYNFLIFVGAFAGQWGFGGVIDVFKRAGYAETDGFRAALLLLSALQVLSLLWWWLYQRRRSSP